MERKKILILGASGMAGHTAYLYLKNTNKYKLHGTVNQQVIKNKDYINLNVYESDSLFNLVAGLKPDFIINCIGSLVANSNNNPHEAIYVNAYLPNVLKNYIDQLGGKLIHLSTDCVFSGKTGNYAENDKRDADDIYGRTKILGEIKNERDITLRMSIIGPELKKEGVGLFNWIIHQQNQVYGYTNAIWSGITTLALAESIELVIENDLSGLFHLTNGNAISKYELLSLINKTYDLNLNVIHRDIPVVNKSLQSSSKFDFPIPDYQTMLLRMKEWYDQYKHHLID